MAEKKVTVRFSAEGGRIVREEMRGLGVAGTKAFNDIALANKSAAQSARVFAAALDAEDRAFDALKASLDPAYAATRRYEDAVEQATAAVRAGIATQEEANRVIAMARTRLDTFGNVVVAQGRGFNAYRGQIQNAAFQIGDFAVQVGAGTAASTALAMQLPQLLGGMGMIGALLGAGAAIGIPLLTAAFRDNKEEAATLEDQIESLAQAMSALETARDAAIANVADMTAVYAANTAQAREFLGAQRQIAEIQAQQALATARDSALAEFGDFGGMTADGFRRAAEEVERLRAEEAALNRERAQAQADGLGNFVDIEARAAAIRNAMQTLGDTNADIARIAELFDVSRASAVDLIEAMLRVSQADGPMQATAAAEELAAMMAQATDNFRYSTDGARELGGQLLEVVLQGYRLEQLQIAGPIESAIGVAGTLVTQLRNGAAAAWDMANGVLASAMQGATAAMGDDERGSQRAATDMSANGLGDFRAQQGLAAARRNAAAYLAPASSAGGPGGGTSAADEAIKLAEDLEERVSGLLGQLDPAVAAAQEYAESQNTLNDAWEAGVITAQEHAIAMGQLTAGYNAARAAASPYADEIKDISRALGQVVLHGESFREQMANIWLGIADDLWNSGIEAAMQAVFSPGRSSGGNIFSSILSAASFAAGPATGNTGTLGLPSFDGGGHTGNGARSGGLDGRGGFLAMLHPKERVHDETKGQGGVVELILHAAQGVTIEQVRNTANAVVRQAAPATIQAATDNTLKQLGKSKANGRPL